MVKTIGDAFKICGEDDCDRYSANKIELDSLVDLIRGVFAKRDILKGESYGKEDVFFAMPVTKGQITSEIFTVHNLSFVAKCDHKRNAAIYDNDVNSADINLKLISNTIHKVKGLLNKSRIVVNKDSKIELSHHYGVEKLDKTGAVLIDCINEEYCKKIIIMIAGQKHPMHHHIKKKESFQILAGSMIFVCEGVSKELFPGDIVTIEKMERHSFYTDNGVVFEEVSTTHHNNDSIYNDDLINANNERKTNLHDWWIKF